MSKPLPILSHMPFHIKQKIVESVDTMTKFSLRQCSKDFKYFIENSKIHIESLMLLVRRIHRNSSERRITLTVTFQENESIKLVFEPSGPNRYLIEHYKTHAGPSSMKLWRIDIVFGNFIDAAVEKFVKLLRIYPKVLVKQFDVNLRGYYERSKGLEAQNQQILGCLEGCLTSLRRAISVKELVIRTNPNQHDILRILLFLKPGTLESIRLGPCKRYDRHCIVDMELDKVAESLQWKQAKHLDINQWYHSLPEKDTLHFETVRCEVRVVTATMLRECVQNFLVHSHWKRRAFHCDDYDMSALWHSLSQYGRKQNFDGNHYRRMYTISEECELFFMMGHDITLRDVDVRRGTFTI